MKARVINYPAGPVVAFGGCEFVNYEWRVVPAGHEAEAERHPFLEVEAPVAKEPEQAPVEVAEPEEAPAPKPKPKAKPKRKTTTRRKSAKAKDE